MHIDTLWAALEQVASTPAPPARAGLLDAVPEEFREGVGELFMDRDAPLASIWLAELLIEDEAAYQAYRATWAETNVTAAVLGTQRQNPEVVQAVAAIFNAGEVIPTFHPILAAAQMRELPVTSRRRCW